MIISTFIFKICNFFLYKKEWLYYNIERMMIKIWLGEVHYGKEEEKV